MWHSEEGRRITIAALGVALVVLTACGAGVSKSEYDSVKQQLEAQQEKTANLQQQLSAQQKAPTPAAVAQQVSAGVTTLIGAKKAPPPTPPPPAPAGAPTAAPRVRPASLNEPVAYSFYVETLATTTVSKFGYASTVSCTPNSVFQRGMKLVWRVEIVDVATGKRVTDEDGSTVKVQLPNGEEATGRFSQRGGGRVPDAPWMWSAAWDIPVEYPLGALDFTVTVTRKDGRSFTWKTPAVISAEADSRVKIIG